MEDIDVAFYRGVTRENLYSSGLPTEIPDEVTSMPGPLPPLNVPTQTMSSVTLSGLLGAIDDPDSACIISAVPIPYLRA